MSNSSHESSDERPLVGSPRLQHMMHSPPRHQMPSMSCPSLHLSAPGLSAADSSATSKLQPPGNLHCYASFMSSGPRPHLTDALRHLLAIWQQAARTLMALGHTLLCCSSLQTTPCCMQMPAPLQTQQARTRAFPGLAPHTTALRAWAGQAQTAASLMSELPGLPRPSAPCSFRHRSLRPQPRRLWCPADCPPWAVAATGSPPRTSWDASFHPAW